MTFRCNLVSRVLATLFWKTTYQSENKISAILSPVLEDNISVRKQDISYTQPYSGRQQISQKTRYQLYSALFWKTTYQSENKISAILSPVLEDNISVREQDISYTQPCSRRQHISQKTRYQLYSALFWKTTYQSENKISAILSPVLEDNISVRKQDISYTQP